jgi:uncharacterized protein YcbX
MFVAEIWRYPVKSMAGERLQRASVGPRGIAGDRRVYVRDERGRIATSRTRPRLLGHRATLGADGEALVDGRPWRSPEVLAEAREIAGPRATLEPYPEGAFDILPLLVATDGAIAAFGHDGRRLRPNIVIGGVEGLAERGWEGRRLRVGAATIGAQDLRQRCVMTTFDPDTLAQDVGILKEIVRKFDGSLALNCFVIEGGEIAVGDPVELVEER